MKVFVRIILGIFFCGHSVFSASEDFSLSDLALLNTVGTAPYRSGVTISSLDSSNMLSAINSELALLTPEGTYYIPTTAQPSNYRGYVNLSTSAIILKPGTTNQCDVLSFDQIARAFGSAVPVSQPLYNPSINPFSSSDVSAPLSLQEVQLMNASSASQIRLEAEQPELFS